MFVLCDESVKAFIHAILFIPRYDDEEEQEELLYYIK